MIAKDNGMNDIVTSLTDIALKESSIWMPKIMGLIATIVVFIIVTKIVRTAIVTMTKRLGIDNHLAGFLVRIASILIMILGLVTALGTLGINVSALVAGLGLTGFALGFALKDTISNLLSGVLILLYRPFKIGNSIKIAGYQGKVIKIDLRYTELQYEENKILIPNSKLFTDPITVINSDNASL